MKFTVIFATILSISWALKVNPEVKGKREAPTRYQFSGSYPFGGGGGVGGHSVGSAYSPAFQSYGEDASSAVSIGAGYSIGGAKPSFGYAQYAPAEDGQGLSSAEAANHQATLQLPAITLQGEQGSGYVSNDLSQLMSQLSHGINSGQLKLAPFQGEEQTGHNAQAISVPQYTLEEPKLQQYVLSQQHGLPSVPSYAAGTKGLGSYSSTGPVLFSQQASGNPFGLAYGYSNGGQSLETGVPSNERLQSGSSLEDSGHLGSGAAHGFLGRDVSFGSYGGSKGVSLPGKAFKPSIYAGSVGDSGHGHGAPSFASSSFPGGHALSLSPAKHAFGSAKGSYGGSKFFSPAYPAPKKGYNSLDSFSSGSHSPPRTTYGVPTATYSSVPSSSLSPSSYSPQYYMKYPSFGDGTSFKGVLPIRGHALTGGSSGHRYTFGSHSAGNFAPVKDTEGSYSENSYDTIKYSEEMKPQM